MKSLCQDIPLTLEELIPGGKNYNKYRVDMPRKMAWQQDRLLYFKGDSILIAPSSPSETPEVFLSLNELNAGLQACVNIQLKSLLQVQFVSPQANDLMIGTSEKIYLYDFTDKKINATFNIVARMRNHDLSPKSHAIAYTRDNNLYIQNSDGKEYALSDEKDTGIVYGQSVHRNEFGINKGTFWSNKGDLLAFYRMDETMVTDYPLVNVSTRVAELKNIKYPMAGMKSHHVTVGVYNKSTQNITYLDTGKPKEKYLTNIAWSPDDKSIYLAELNRGQDTCTVKCYDAATGKLKKVLFTETHPKYVEPENPVLFLKNDADKFLWQSKRDGYNHLYLYDTNGNLLKQVTSGEWDVTAVIGFDEMGENLIFESTEGSPVENHIFKVNLNNGKRIRLTKEEGVHHAMLSASGKFISDRYSSQYNPGKVAITETKTTEMNIFYIAKNPYRNITLPEISLGSIKADDGITDLYYRLVKPLNFDETKKYPVIIYVYGGPHSQLVNNSWMGQARGWDIYMAEKGYLVFTLDNRGTNNRGFEFENITHRQLGVIETQDQMTGVEFLMSLPYTDNNRIGVHGWSYGGFMTLNMMLRHSDIFKVGVAGGPVTDWKYYEIMYGERYMDTPQKNQEGYEETSMVDRAGNLEGRLLLIHGDEDPTVVMQHSLEFLKAAIKAGTHPDFFIYPGHGHNMTGTDRVHLHEHITRYFDDFLK